MGNESEEEKKSEITSLLEYANHTQVMAGSYRQPSKMVNSFNSFVLGDKSSENIENNLSYEAKLPSKESTPAGSILRRLKGDSKKSSHTEAKLANKSKRF